MKSYLIYGYQDVLLQTISQNHTKNLQEQMGNAHPQSPIQYNKDIRYSTNSLDTRDSSSRNSRPEIRQKSFLGQQEPPISPPDTRNQTHQWQRVFVWGRDGVMGLCALIVGETDGAEHTPGTDREHNSLRSSLSFLFSFLLHV